MFSMLTSLARAKEVKTSQKEIIVEEIFERVLPP